MLGTSNVVGAAARRPGSEGPGSTAGRFRGSGDWPECGFASPLAPEFVPEFVSAFVFAFVFVSASRGVAGAGAFAARVGAGLFAEEGEAPAFGGVVSPAAAVALDGLDNDGSDEATDEGVSGESGGAAGRAIVSGVARAADAAAPDGLVPLLGAEGARLRATAGIAASDATVSACFGVDGGRMFGAADSGSDVAGVSAGISTVGNAISLVVAGCAPASVWSGIEPDAADIATGEALVTAGRGSGSALRSGPSRSDRVWCRSCPGLVASVSCTTFPALPARSSTEAATMPSTTDATSLAVPESSGFSAGPGRGAPPDALSSSERAQTSVSSASVSACTSAASVSGGLSVPPSAAAAAVEWSAARGQAG
ncbi:MAG TPA: hypothetical protein VNK48_16595, partial [Xanthobacteraceae bacterium]|nr:hypothetical protein [Xanthobacteraceae bacterium]